MERTTNDRIDTRTSTERIVNKQLHAEIQQRKQLEQEIHDALEYANGIINTVRDPIIVLDKELKVISASRSFYQFFNVKIEDTEKKHIFDLGDHQWDIPKLRELLEEILPKKKSFDNFEVEHSFPGIGLRVMLLNARKIYRKFNHTELILLAIEDITELRKLDTEREKYVKSLENINKLIGKNESKINVFKREINKLLNELKRPAKYEYKKGK